MPGEGGPPADIAPARAEATPGIEPVHVALLQPGFKGWLRWELSRRIEITFGLKLIILDRFVKAIALVGGGIALLIAERTGALKAIAERIQAELNVDPGRRLWLRLTEYLLQHLTALGGGAEVALAIAAILYGVLEVVEGGALLLRRRWAEYLVLFATCAFIPLEVDELIHHPTVLKGLALLVNIAIAAYLVVRKRLFFDDREPV